MPAITMQLRVNDPEFITDKYVLIGDKLFISWVHAGLCLNGFVRHAINIPAIANMSPDHVSDALAVKPSISVRWDCVSDIQAI